MYDGQHIFKAAQEKRIKRWFRKPRNQRDTLLMHHRWPTSTINTKSTAHPFATDLYFGETKYVLVHNGIISNASELKLAHEKLGIIYHSVLDDGSFNDSEALLWDFALTMEGKQEALQVKGDIAFICMKNTADGLDKLFFGRNTGRPLKLFRDKHAMLISSEGQGEEIGVNTLYTFNYALQRLTKRHMSIPTRFTSYWDNQESVAFAKRRTSVCNPAPYSSGFDEDDFYVNERGHAVYYADARYDQYNADNDEYVSTPIYTAPVDEDVYAPTASEVNTLLLRTLAEHDGNYARAYWDLENRWSLLDQDISELSYGTTDQYLELALLEATSEALNSDPLFVDSKSTHVFWETTAQLALNVIGEPQHA